MSHISFMKGKICVVIIELTFWSMFNCCQACSVGSVHLDNGVVWWQTSIRPLPWIMINLRLIDVQRAVILGYAKVAMNLVNPYITFSCSTVRQSLLNWALISSGVGVTKPISSVPLISRFFTIVKTLVTYWISCSYLTGVAAAQLRWHLSNMNVIQII